MIRFLGLGYFQLLQGLILCLLLHIFVWKLFLTHDLYFQISLPIFCNKNIVINGNLTSDYGTHKPGI